MGSGARRERNILIVARQPQAEDPKAVVEDCRVGQLKGLKAFSTDSACSARRASDCLARVTIVIPQVGLSALYYGTRVAITLSRPAACSVPGASRDFQHRRQSTETRSRIPGEPIPIVLTSFPTAPSYGRCSTYEEPSSVRMGIMKILTQGRAISTRHYTPY